MWLVHHNAFLSQNPPHLLYVLARTEIAVVRLTWYTSLLSFSSVSVPVTRVNPAKKNSAILFIESTVGCAANRGELVAM